MPRKKITHETECAACFGCGHICTRCDFPVNSCECKELHTDSTECDEMKACAKCAGEGALYPRNHPKWRRHVVASA